MPLQLLEDDSSEEGDLNLINAYLEQILELPLPDASVEIVERKRLGTVSHTFSHIQLTLRVQSLVIRVSFSIVAAF